LRASNEPCVDRTAPRRWELVHNRLGAVLDTYGECRDSHKPRSGVGTVGMAHCVLFFAILYRHAWTGCRTNSESLLSDGRSADWTHTANAATVTSRRAAQGRSAWLIASCSQQHFPAVRR